MRPPLLKSSALAALPCCALLVLTSEKGFGIDASFTSGPSSNPVLFETSADSLLIGGHLFAGAFETAPPVGISFSEIVSNFEIFAPLNTNPSTGFGFFMNGAFEGTLTTPDFDFASEQIYVLALDTASLETATEFALLTSDTWTFQSSNIDPTIPLVDLPEVDTLGELLAGTFDTADIGGTIFTSIQLTAIGPLDPPVLPEIRHVIVSGQPGIEFEFPSADASTVSFVLQESVGDTLLEPDWVDVAASPTVINDDGTTQTIQILHPDLVTDDSELFFRLVGTSL